MKITFFNRYQGNRFSIEKVTSSIIREVEKEHEVESYSVPHQAISIPNMIKNILFVHRNRSKNGINHITGDIHYCMLGLIGTKNVLTIHDTVFLTGKQNKISYFLKWLLWLYIPCLIADKIICISEKTRQEVISHRVSGKRIVVINDPVELYPVGQEKNVSNRTEILHIGTKENKNLVRVIRSLDGLDCHLTIVGKLNEEQTKELQKAGLDYTNVFGISEEELSSAYSKANIVSFPSTYEGFGMPIIEGQLADCVILTSKISPMTDVGLDSVYYVDPYDESSIRNGFSDLMQNETLRKQLVEKGRRNALRFSPEEIAKQYITMYSSMS